MHGATVCGLQEWYKKIFEHSGWKMICSCVNTLNCSCDKKHEHFKFEMDQWFVKKAERCRKAIEATQKVDLDIMEEHLVKLYEHMDYVKENGILSGGRKKSKKGSKKVKRIANKN